MGPRRGVRWASLNDAQSWGDLGEIKNTARLLNQQQKNPRKRRDATIWIYSKTIYRSKLQVAMLERRAEWSDVKEGRKENKAGLRMLEGKSPLHPSLRG